MLCAIAGAVSAAPVINASEILCHEVMGMLQERSSRQRAAAKISLK
jgi:hypothetical protein